MISQENALARTARRMVDPKYGIANRLVELGASPLAPDVFVTCADGGPPSYMTDHARANWHNCSNASGAAYHREEACWATLGELAERYCASIYDRASFYRGTGAALGKKALPINEMILQSECQYNQADFPFKRFDHEAEMEWVAGIDIALGRQVYAPAQLLYLSHEWAETMLMQTVSTGLACHSDREKVRLSALLELIERDGFASAWLLGMPLPRLHLNGADRVRLSPQTLRALGPEGLDITLYALPNEFGVANIVAVAEHDTLGFGVVGAAANICPYKAIEKAVLEALHGWIGFSQTTASRKATLARDEIATPHDHAIYYMNPAHWAELSWFIKEGETITLKAVQAGPPVKTSTDLVQRLRMHGFGAYLFDLTTDDIRCLGLQVLRALVPGLQPLCFGKAPISEDRWRLRKYADFWNWPMPKYLTTQPHPFP